MVQIRAGLFLLGNVEESLLELEGERCSDDLHPARVRLHRGQVRGQVHQQGKLLPLAGHDKERDEVEEVEVVDWGAVGRGFAPLGQCLPNIQDTDRALLELL